MRRRVLAGSLLLVAALCLMFGGRALPARAATILFQPGTYLVAGPAGTVFTGALDPLYTLDPTTQTYIAVPANQPVQAGVGYFATFTTLTNVRLSADDGRPVSIQAPAGVWMMIGNPFAYSNASVLGADVVYGYDPDQGYVIESTLPPGRGALVFSSTGGTITIRPLPSAIDLRAAQQQDQLIDATLPLSAFPPDWAIRGISGTFSDSNNNIPNQYIVTYFATRRLTASDPIQTSTVTLNLQVCKDAAFAAQIVQNANAGRAGDLYDSGVVSTGQQQITSPPGNDAALFYVVTQAGNTRTGHYVLFFRRGRVFVLIQTNEPAGRMESDFVLGLARKQDALLQQAFGS